jgi:hypothetical protein
MSDTKQKAKSATQKMNSSADSKSEFLITNTLVEFRGHTHSTSTVSIPKGAKCAPLLADLFLYSYEAKLIQNLIKYKNLSL